MKIVVTNFSCDNGHLGAFNLLTSKNRFIQKINDECLDIGEDWLNDYDIAMHDFRRADSAEKIIELCRKVCTRGHLNIIDV